MAKGPQNDVWNPSLKAADQKDMLYEKRKIQITSIVLFVLSVGVVVGGVMGLRSFSSLHRVLEHRSLSDIATQLGCTVCVAVGSLSAMLSLAIFIYRLTDESADAARTRDNIPLRSFVN